MSLAIVPIMENSSESGLNGYEVGRLCVNKLLQSEKKIAEGFFFAKYFKTPFTVPSSEITPAVFLKIRHSSLIEHTQCKRIM